MFESTAAWIISLLNRGTRCSRQLWESLILTGRKVARTVWVQSNYNRANVVTVWQPTHRMADVTVTKIAGYVRVRILMNRCFFFVFLAMFILFTLQPLCWIYMNVHAMNWCNCGGCGGGLDFAPTHAALRPLLMTTGKSTTTDVDFEPYYI